MNDLAARGVLVAVTIVAVPTDTSFVFGAGDQIGFGPDEQMGGLIASLSSQAGAFGSRLPFSAP